MNTNKQNTLRAAIGLVLASIAACSGTDMGGAPQGDAATARGEGNALNLVDSFALANGAKVTIEQDSEGGLLIGVEGNKETEAEVGELFGNVSGLKDLYSVLAPERAVPEAVTRAIARQSADTALEPLALEPSRIRELDVDGAPDNLARVDKDAPKDTVGFSNTYCITDKILEESVVDGWYRKNDFCQLSRTNDMSRSFVDVRQGYVSVRMYRGSATLQYSSQPTNGTTWTVGATYTITEGNFKAFWATFSVKKNIKYELLNATDDGYNYAIHTAKANYWEKSTAGTDNYHVRCRCTESQTTNQGNTVVLIDDYALEVCASNATPADTRSMATWQCGELWRREIESNRDDSISVSCSTVNYEKVSTGANCGAGINQTLRECRYGDPNGCRISCNATCQ